MADDKQKEQGPSKLAVIITSAKEVLYEGEADFLVVPGKEGVLGIGPDHTKMISLLRKGDIIIKNGSKEKRIDVSEGMIQVNRSGVDILISA